MALDPEFHQAWSAMAVAYSNLPQYDQTANIDENMAASRAAADRALAIEPMATEALAVKSEFAEQACDWVESIRLIKAAIASNPRQPTPHHWYANQLARLGHLRKARQEIDEAHNLDPLISAVVASSALLHVSAGDFDAAIPLAREARELGHNAASIVEQFALYLRGDIAEMSQHGNRRILIYNPLWDSWTAALADPAVLPAFEREALALDGLVQLERNAVADMLAIAGSYEVPRFLEPYACPLPTFFMWSNGFRDQRGTPEFFHLMERGGVVDYWREYGWPDDCASLDQELAECPE